MCTPVTRSRPNSDIPRDDGSTARPDKTSPAPDRAVDSIGLLIASHSTRVDRPRRNRVPPQHSHRAREKEEVLQQFVKFGDQKWVTESDDLQRRRAAVLHYVVSVGDGQRSNYRPNLDGDLVLYDADLELSPSAIDRTPELIDEIRDLRAIPDI